MSSAIQKALDIIEEQRKDIEYLLSKITSMEDRSRFEISRLTQERDHWHSMYQELLDPIVRVKMMQPPGPIVLDSQYVADMQSKLDAAMHLAENGQAEVDELRMKLEMKERIVDQIEGGRGMTVRECFSKAFGPVPDGATCHVCDGQKRPMLGGLYGSPLIWDERKKKWKPSRYADAIDPDISDRPAESFRGFFGPEYDKTLDEVAE